MAFASLRPRLVLAGVLVVAACARTPPPAPVIPADSELPALPVGQVAFTPGVPGPDEPSPTNPLAGRPLGEPITLSAVNVDVRAILSAIAESAGLSLVLGPEIQGRVSVNFIDVPAREALELILQEAGLMIAPEPLEAPFGPVVFYVIPTDIREIGPELIQLRYGVSREMAEWIVESRID